MSDFQRAPFPQTFCEQPVTSATFVSFLEGPAVDADGNLFFSDIAANRIYQLTPSGERSVWREPSGRTNGNTFDREGRLLHCEGAEFGTGGGRRITRTDLKSDHLEVLTDRFDGVRYNSPNDICVDGLGRIYFTDPCYGDRSQMEMSIEGVYRIDLDGTVKRILAQPAIQRPNGIAVTQDSRRLYLVDSCPVVGGNRKIWSYDLDSAGNPSNQQLVIDFGGARGGDGMRLDIEGNLYICAGITAPRGPHESNEAPPGVYIVRPSGELIGRIPIPEDVITNIAFGGRDGRTIYVTAGRNVYTARVKIPGQVAYPQWA